MYRFQFAFQDQIAVRANETDMLLAKYNSIGPAAVRAALTSSAKSRKTIK